MALQHIDDVAPGGGQPPRHWGGFLEASLLIQAVHPDLSGVLLELQPGSSGQLRALAGITAKRTGRFGRPFVALAWNGCHWQRCRFQRSADKMLQDWMSRQ